MLRWLAMSAALMASTSSARSASTVRRSASTSAKPPLTNTRELARIAERGADHARAKRGDDRRVVGEHGELALEARHHHLAGVLRQHHALRRHQLELERACHPSIHPRIRVALPLRLRAVLASPPPRSAAWCRRTGRSTSGDRPCWARPRPGRRAARPTCRARPNHRRRSAARSPRWSARPSDPHSSCRSFPCCCHALFPSWFKPPRPASRPWRRPLR